MKTTRRQGLGILASLAAAPLLGRAAQAQGFPSRPIRYVLHVAPGGATDVMARQLAPGLERVLGQPIVVENRAGGRGAAQLAELASGRPDGHVIGSVTNTHLAAFQTTLRNYSVESFDWICSLVTEPFLLAVHADSPYRTTADLFEAIRQRRGQMVIAGFTRGSGSHIAWEIMLEAGGLSGRDARWVPYDSVAAGVTAVLGRHGEATVAYLDLVREHVRAGTIRVLGVMAERRFDALPDVPTLREQGIDANTGWQQFRGIIGPRGMPGPIKERLAGAVREVLETDEVRRYLREAALEPAFAGPEEFARNVLVHDRLTREWLQRLAVQR